MGWGAGCGSPPPEEFARRNAGLVIVLPGIEGAGALNNAVANGLVEGGVPYQVEIQDWTSWMGPLYNQRAQQRNREQARRIADRIVDYHCRYPGRPVILVGQSGGGAIAVWIAEALGPDDAVDGIILLAASLSPEYPLSRALARSRRGIVNFHSPYDVVYLGLGTSLAGTMDGEHSSSAGRVGFRPPAGTPPYARLFQIPWQSRMASAGNFGVHLSSGSEQFVANYVAPLVFENMWHHGLIHDIATGNYGRGRPSALP